MDIIKFYPKGTGSGSTGSTSDTVGSITYNTPGGDAITACYNCIVNAKATYSVEDIIKGEIRDINGAIVYDTANNVGNSNFIKVRTAYLTALARCRYDLYKISGYFEAEN